MFQLVSAVRSGGAKLPLRHERIAITGMGAVSSLGIGVSSSWDADHQGQTGIQELVEPWAAALPSRLAGVIPGDPSCTLAPLQRRRLDRCSQLAMVAAEEAWHACGLEEASQGGSDIRVAVVVGCGIGGLDTMGQQYRNLLERDTTSTPRVVQPRPTGCCTNSTSPTSAW